MRRIAKKSAKTRAAKKARADTARRRRLAKPPSEEELVEFRREQDEFTAFLIIWAAAQSGEKGIRDLRHRQLKVRSGCVLCRRSFSGADRTA